MPSLIGYTLGDVAKHFNVPTWTVRRIFERRLLPEPGRLGAYRVVSAEDLPKIEAALRRAGYLPGGGDHAA